MSLPDLFTSHVVTLKVLNFWFYYNCSNLDYLVSTDSSALAEFSLVSLPCKYDDESARRSCDDHLYTYK